MVSCVRTPTRELELTAGTGGFFSHTTLTRREIVAKYQGKRLGTNERERERETETYSRLWQTHIRWTVVYSQRVVHEGEGADGGDEAGAEEVGGGLRDQPQFRFAFLRICSSRISFPARSGDDMESSNDKATVHKKALQNTLSRLFAQTTSLTTLSKHQRKSRPLDTCELRRRKEGRAARF